MLCYFLPWHGHSVGFTLVIIINPSHSINTYHTPLYHAVVTLATSPLPNKTITINTYHKQMYFYTCQLIMITNHWIVYYCNQHLSNTCVYCHYTVASNSHIPINDKHQCFWSTRPLYASSSPCVLVPHHLLLALLHCMYKPYSCLDYNLHTPPGAHRGGKVVNKRALHVDYYILSKRVNTNTPPKSPNHEYGGHYMFHHKAINHCTTLHQ